MLQHLILLEYSALSDRPLTSEGRAVEVGNHPHEDDAEATKQRRKIQNRKNQRAHRLRIREQVSIPAQRSRPFQVTRWRLDEHFDDTKSTAAVSISNRPLCSHISASSPDIVTENGIATGWSNSLTQTTLTPPSLTFPLSTDHLLHLVQYNVFRAFVSNKQTLNLLLTGQNDRRMSPTTCPISGPYRDDTCVFPLNPNIPAALTPTLYQQAHPHPIWINLLPFPRMRDNMIRRQGRFDHWELLTDLIGEFLGGNQFPRRQGLPLTIDLTDHEPQDEDVITTGRKGLIVWGEPYNVQSWEATPGFFAKWAWAVEGCDDLLESSNRWRFIRGEDLILPSVSSRES
jgi:hypothetical protein